MLITKRAAKGSLCGHKVYSISDTALVPLVQPNAQVRCASRGFGMTYPPTLPLPHVAGT